jgi:hypothetical protein
MQISNASRMQRSNETELGENAWPILAGSESNFPGGKNWPGTEGKAMANARGPRSKAAGKNWAGQAWTEKARRAKT